ncbi:MAG: hypothetical protein K2G89_11490, partial [Lachnospiraceae bacterium]|nr:hypothetical protein [Lachnospiraceae bacterium]
YEDFVDGILGKYFDEYKFYMKFQSEWITNNLPVDTKLEDLRNYTANIDYPLPELTIYLPPEEDSTIFLELAENLSEEKYRGGIAIKQYKYKEQYQTKNRNDWGNDEGEDGLNYNISCILVYADGSVEQIQ